MSKTLKTVPNIDGSNYDCWNFHMRFFLKSINVWHEIEFGFKVPQKPTAEWFTVEKQTRMANDKAMNAFTKLSSLEFQIVIVPEMHGRDPRNHI